MGRGEKVDYRISMLVVLCKDCNQDVGLYPARHQCQVERPPLPPLPPLPTQKSDPPPPSTSLLRKASSPALSRFTSTRQPSPPSTNEHQVARSNTTTTSASPKWSSFRRSNNSKPNSPTDDVKDDPMNATSYLDHYAAHLPPGTNSESSGGGTSLKKKWGSVKQNEKWKQFLDKGDQQKQQQSSAKLWKKLVQATQTMAIKDERGPESDDSDWEGESHVSRILREYHEKKHHSRLPSWLLDDRNCRTMTQVKTDDDDDDDHLLLKRQASSRRRLWDKASVADQEPTARELERQIMRQEHHRNSRRQQQQPSSTTLMHDSDYSDDVDVDNTNRYHQTSTPHTSTNGVLTNSRYHSNNSASSSPPRRCDDDNDATDSNNTNLRKNKRLERMQSARRCMEDHYRDNDDQLGARDDLLNYYGGSGNNNNRSQQQHNDHRVDELLSLRQARLSRSRSDRAIRSAYQQDNNTQATEITPSNYRSFMKQDRPLADLPTTSLGRQYSATTRKPSSASSKQRYLVPEQRNGLGLF